MEVEEVMEVEETRHTDGVPVVKHHLDIPGLEALCLFVLDGLPRLPDLLRVPVPRRLVRQLPHRTRKVLLRHDVLRMHRGGWGSGGDRWEGSRRGRGKNSRLWGRQHTRRQRSQRSGGKEHLFLTLNEMRLCLSIIPFR